MLALLASALGAPTCPAPPCTWAFDNRYLPIAEPQVATAPVVYPIPAGAAVVGVLLLPTTPTVDGSIGGLRFGADGRLTDLTAADVPPPGALPDAWGAFPVPVGTSTVDGRVVTLHASLVTLTVPEGARELQVVPSKRAGITVLGFGGWTAAGAPFPFVPDHSVADTSWGTFAIRADETLKLPRPAALGPIVPVTTRVRRDGEELVDDAGPVRLYGTNLGVGWDLPTPADSERQASAFAAHGFNLVRLTVFPVSRSLLYEGKPVRTPTEEEWDRLDALLDAYARHGIRVQLPLVPNDVGAGPTTAAIDRAGNTYVYPVIDPAARARQQQWMRDLLTHPNRRRGCSLADDPMVLDVEVANESGLMRAWLAGVYEVLPEPWLAKLEVQWNDWLRAKYGNDTAITAAWTGGVDSALRRRETLGTILVEPQIVSRWSLWPVQRRRDLALFHVELDTRYYTEMRRFLREDLGVDALIEGTQFLAGPASTAIQAALNDFGDTHFQYDHPSGQPQEQDRRPLTSFLLDKGIRLVVQQAVYGMPYLIGEYNYGWPSPYEYEAPLFMAALGARQGWSALTWFTWRHRGWVPEGAPKIEGPMDLAANPVKVGQLVAAAAIVRGGLIPAAEGLCITTVDGSVTGPAFPVGAPLAGNGEGLVDCRYRTVFEGQPLPAARPTTPGPVTWDDQSTFVVDVPGASVILTDGDTRSTRWLRAGGAPGAISVLGLDTVDLSKAKRWLLSVGTRALNTGHRESGSYTITDSGAGPVLLAPWRGVVAVMGAKTPTVTRLGPDGNPAGDVPVTKGKDGYILELTRLPPSTWYIVAW